MRLLMVVAGQRLLLGLGTLLLVSLIIFSAVQLLPGDAAESLLGQSATPETLAALRAEMRLDEPAPQRYLAWVRGLASGDLGQSLGGQRPVAALLRERLPNTLFLAGVAALISVPLSIGLGLLCALYRNTVLDRMLNLLALGTASFPEFFVAYVLVIVLAVHLMAFPPLSAIDPGMTLAVRLYQSVLPALTLTLATTAYMMRMTRASILGVMSAPFIEMAHLKGVTPARVIWRHALANAVAPIANVVALSLAYMVAGVVVVETVFVYPGLGQLLVDSVSKRDLPVIQVISLLFAGIYVVLNLLADLLAIFSNPRLLHR
jgi:peptide/nickel transport system permease protein